MLAPGLHVDRCFCERTTIAIAVAATLLAHRERIPVLESLSAGQFERCRSNCQTRETLLAQEIAAAMGRFPSKKVGSTPTSALAIRRGGRMRITRQFSILLILIPVVALAAGRQTYLRTVMRESRDMTGLS